MKIAHFADFQIDRTASIDGRGTVLTGPSGHNIRLDDADRVFAGFVDSMIEQGIELALFAGDLHEDAYPSTDEILIVRSHLRRLAQHCPVILITGNHDLPGIVTRSDPLALYEGLHRHIRVSRRPEVIDVNGVRIFTLPYPARQTFLSAADMGRAVNGTEANAMITTALNAVMTNATAHATAARADGRKAFLLAHAQVVGSVTGSGYEIGADEVCIGRDHFRYFDYVALGHIHKRQQVAPNAYYSGSMFTANQGERHEAKGWLLIDTATCRPEFIDMSLLSRPHITLDLGNIDVPSDEPSDWGQPPHAVVRIRYRIPEDSTNGLGYVHRVEQMARERGAIYVYTDPEFIPIQRQRITLPTEHLSDITIDQAIDIVAELDNGGLADLKPALIEEHAQLLASLEA